MPCGMFVINNDPSELTLYSLSLKEIFISLIMCSLISYFPSLFRSMNAMALKDPVLVELAI